MNYPSNHIRKDNKPLLLLIVTSKGSMSFFAGQIRFLLQSGFNVAVVCSPGWDNPDEVPYYPISMEREISPLKDLVSLFKLVRLLLRIRPEIVNAGTPKAGLLGMTAAYVCRVPLRIFTCHGMRLETLTGWKKVILTMTEKLTAFCAHHVVCVSESLRQKYIALQITQADKVTIIGNGSCNGIATDKYSNSQTGKLQAQVDFQMKYGISSEARCIGFVGRLVRDKGIYELVAAFEQLQQQYSNVYLLLLGGFEEGDPISVELREKIKADEKIVSVGFVTDTLPYYRRMDVLVLPTYREGLPTVLLEAGAMGLPVVATTATGCVDVIADGETGFLVPIGDSKALAEAIDKMLSDTTLAAMMSRRARERVERLFDQRYVWENTVRFYRTVGGKRLQ